MNGTVKRLINDKQVDGEGRMGRRTHLRVAVEHGEIGNNDRHGQRDGQHAGQGAQSADEHADVRLGHHVSVADGGHGHNGPPKAFRDALSPQIQSEKFNTKKFRKKIQKNQGILFEDSTTPRFQFFNIFSFIKFSYTQKNPKNPKKI